MQTVPFLLATALLLAGCTGDITTKDGSRRYAGHLVMAPALRVFVPCNSHTPLWLATDKTTEHRLEDQYTTLVSELYEETFAVLYGAPGPQLNCAGCRNFPGSFQVTQVLEHRQAESEDCH